MTEKEALLVLNAVPGFGNATIRKVLDFFGSGQEVFKASDKVLQTSGVLAPKLIAALRAFNVREFLRVELSLMEKRKVTAVTYTDENYPALLREIPDAPVVIYLLGQLLPEQQMAIALVGSRQASVYGVTVAEEFSMRLAELGITIVSGLARGIDTAAHRGTLKARGTTLAVLGCGLNSIYPPENEHLAKQVAESGAVISEFPMTMSPLACNFPRRNRIISGLSLGVVVVEAAHKSGALITSRFALEQGREVFAVPGNVRQPNSRGVHELIKQGAKLVQGIDDILEELAPQLKRSQPVENTQKDDIAPVELSVQEAAVVDCLADKPVFLEELGARAQIPLAQIHSVILGLELKKIIKQLPGKFFVRI